MSENNYEPRLSIDSTNNSVIKDNLNDLSNLNDLNENNVNLITNTPPSKKETIIKFHTNNDNVYKKQFIMSPVSRRTPNSKADLLIQKIYLNRKNVIKHLQSSKRDINRDINRDNQVSKTNEKEKKTYEQLKINIKTCESESDLSDKNIDSLKNISETPSHISHISHISDNSSESSPDNSTYSISEECSSNNNIEKKKRKFYKGIKFKKNQNIKQLNMNEIQLTNEENVKSSPLSSPRDISEDLWNDSIENYYSEFQKLCKEESSKYKNLSYRNEIISNFLKFTLLISGCFTFTLSISIPNSLFMNTTTMISSCLTAIITSVTGFFQFDKKSEIQYNIYRELDKLYNIISLELLKPTYMRSDPYEFILSLRTRRDELLKTLLKK